MTLYTIGYGGRAPSEFIELLTQHSIRTIVDVRLRPDRASMGSYALAKSPDKGIEKLLTTAGIAYVSVIPLGNVFLGRDDWEEAYQQLLACAGDLLTAPVFAPTLAAPLYLLCAEKDPAQCHRSLITTYLERKGHAIMHII
jgi:uncharacterized protein (DUF488 family)